MRNITDILDVKHKKSLRLGLLLVSTLFIISASALVYARVSYENALNVGGSASGVTTGSGTTVPVGESLPPALIVVIAFSALVISISLFGFLREAIKHMSKASGGRESPLTGPASMPRGDGIGLSSQPSSKQGEDWEESPRKEEGEE